MFELPGSAIDVPAPASVAHSGQDPEWLRRCIEEYREPISFTVDDYVPKPESFANKLKALVDSRVPFLESAEESARAAVSAVVAKVEQVAAVTAVSDDNKNLNSEVVHENEQEEEAEEEAEEEEQKQSAFSREDEQHNPWPTVTLTTPPPAELTPGEDDDVPIYALAEYRSRSERPLIPFPPMIKITDNFFRPPARWSGVGERRLKNVVFLLEWIPEPREGGGSGGGQRFLVALSLAEGETLRRLIHTEEELLRSVGLALRYSESDLLLDRSAAFHSATAESADLRSLQTGLQCLRFFNSDMYYSDDEIEVLLEGLKDTSADQRREFFSECLRLRQREKRLWGETPLAKVLTEREEWGELAVRSLIEQVNASLLRIADRGGGGGGRIHAAIETAFAKAAAAANAGAGGITARGMQALFASLGLGFSPADVAKLYAHACAGEATLSHTSFLSTFSLPLEEDVQEPEPEQQDAVGDEMFDPDGFHLYDPSIRRCPPDKWECSVAQGGCSYFNPKALFYCDMCSKARPDLSAVRF
jgi:hypothetical protein